MICPHCHTPGQVFLEINPDYKDIVCLPCGYRRSAEIESPPIPKHTSVMPERYPHEAKVLAVTMRQSGMQYNFIREYINQRYGLRPSSRAIYMWARQ
jgi:hypothetical protein